MRIRTLLPFMLMITAPAIAQSVPKDAVQEWPTVTGSTRSVISYSDRNHPPVSVEPAGGSAIPALPLNVMTSGDITYVTGGIGEEEEAQLRSQYGDYNLHILMSAPGGEYVSEVAMRIMDKGGNEILSVPSAGPYFYGKLPAGTYTVEMTAPQGGIKKFTTRVPASGTQHVTFQEMN